MSGDEKYYFLRGTSPRARKWAVSRSSMTPTGFFFSPSSPSRLSFLLSPPKRVERLAEL